MSCLTFARSCLSDTAATATSEDFSARYLSTSIPCAARPDRRPVATVSVDSVSGSSVGFLNPNVISINRAAFTGSSAEPSYAARKQRWWIDKIEFGARRRSWAIFDESGLAPLGRRRSAERLARVGALQWRHGRVWAAESAVRAASRGGKRKNADHPGNAQNISDQSHRPEVRARRPWLLADRWSTQSISPALEEWIVRAFLGDRRRRPMARQHDRFFGHRKHFRPRSGKQVLVAEAFAENLADRSGEQRIAGEDGPAIHEAG